MLLSNKISLLRFEIFTYSSNMFFIFYLQTKMGHSYLRDVPLLICDLQNQENGQNRISCTLHYGVGTGKLDE